MRRDAARSPAPKLEIARETIGSRIKHMVGWREIQFGDERFDRTFHVSADRADEARRLLDARVRERLLEDAPDHRVAIHLSGQRLLYCCARTEVEARGELLDVAKRLHDALPVR